ncbi:MAG TPA: alginate lyase family protein [Candidatus Eisenbacteria bacterium]|nr:alginate lyase family protein [Candidatus Eisenbacteria bacterium]
MRSPREITFRLRQEAANALLALSSPNKKLQANTPLSLLPNPSSVAGTLRDTDYARDLIGIADQILDGRIPIFGSMIDCGPTIAWRRDPQSGIETPAQYFRRIPYLDPAAVGDHKLIWEVNRHQHLVALAQAAVITGSEVYGDHVFRQLEHWWAENPFQRGINWVSALEVAFRALSWTWIFHLIGDRMSDDFRRSFLAELYRHGLHLEYNLSIYFSPNTHLLGEAVALHTLGRLFPAFPRAGRWRTLGSDIVRRHMQACVKPDGSYFEQSTYYHLYALDMFAIHAVLEDVPAAYCEKLARMAEFLASIVCEAGDLPFLGDDDGGRLFSPYGPRSRFARATLATASVLAGKRFFPYTQRDINEIALWWMGPARCQVSPADSHRPRSRAFDDAGLVVMRRHRIGVLFDAGPFASGSGGHSHSDTLSLVVSAGDRELLVDSGTYGYMDAGWRNLFRGSAAHNTVRIDGRDQATPAGPFRWTDEPQVKLLEFATDAGKDRAVATCCYQGFSHTRTVEVTDAGLSVVDQIEGPGGEHDIEQFWHVALEPRALAAGQWDLGGLAELIAEGSVLEPGWRSRCFNAKQPAAVIVVRRCATLPLTLHTRLRLNP